MFSLKSKTLAIFFLFRVPQKLFPLFPKLVGLNPTCSKHINSYSYSTISGRYRSYLHWCSAVKGNIQYSLTKNDSKTKFQNESVKFLSIQKANSIKRKIY